MVRRSQSRQRYRARVSLFSFIDVLGGLIGALCLIIIGVSLSQIVPESSSASPLTPQIRVFETEIQQKRKQIEELRDEIAQMKESKIESETARNRLIALKQKAKQNAIRQGYIAQALTEKEALRKRIADRQKQRDKLQTELSQLDQTVREDQGTVKRDRIEVRFAGRGLNLKPIFVECTRDGLIIHDKGNTERIDRRNIAISDSYSVLVDRVKATAGGTVIFLVRPNGIRAFNLASTEADKRKVRSGKLPIPGQGELDLEHFTEQLDNVPSG